MAFAQMMNSMSTVFTNALLQETVVTTDLQVPVISQEEQEQKLHAMQLGFARSTQYRAQARREAAAMLRVQQAKEISRHFNSVLEMLMPELKAIANTDVTVKSEMEQFEEVLIQVANARVGDTHFGPMLDLMELAILETTSGTQEFVGSYELMRNLMEVYIMPIAKAQGDVETLIVLSNTRPGSYAKGQLKDAYEVILGKLENDVYFDGKITTARVAEMRAEVKATGKVNLSEAVDKINEAQGK